MVIIKNHSSAYSNEDMLKKLDALVMSIAARMIHLMRCSNIFTDVWFKVTTEEEIYIYIYHTVALYYIASVGRSQKSMMHSK